MGYGRPPGKTLRVEEIEPRHAWLCLTGKPADQVPAILTARGYDAVKRRWWGYVVAADTHPTGGGIGVRLTHGWHMAEHITVSEDDHDGTF